ncbi:MAG: hypothetical protein DELT_02926 [Desulfovibrio sp.]
MRVSGFSHTCQIIFHDLQGGKVTAVNSAKQGRFRFGMNGAGSFFGQAVAALFFRFGPVLHTLKLLFRNGLCILGSRFTQLVHLVLVRVPGVESAVFPFGGADQRKRQTRIMVQSAVKMGVQRLRYKIMDECFLPRLDILGTFSMRKAPVSPLGRIRRERFFFLPLGSVRRRHDAAQFALLFRKNRLHKALAFFFGIFVS